MGGTVSSVSQKRGDGWSISSKEVDARVISEVEKEDMEEHFKWVIVCAFCGLGEMVQYFF